VQNVANAADKTQKIVFSLKNTAYTPSEPHGQAWVNVQQSIDTVLGVYQNYLSQGIEVMRQYDSLPQVWGTEDELAQVWTNLLINSIQAMKAQGQISIAMRQVEQVYEIRFTDNGPGIPAEVLPKIFNPLFTTKPKGEGTGMGLHIVKRIVEAHRGTIEVQSTTGRTEFIIRLPATGPEPSAA
jgi:signal transduction histidine kinase